ncbi:hypothetical protein ACJBYS_11840, partial [Streptococcus suis]
SYFCTLVYTKSFNVSLLSVNCSLSYKNTHYNASSVAAYFQGIGYDNRQLTRKVVSPTLAKQTIERCQTRDGVLLPKS